MKRSQITNDKYHFITAMGEPILLSVFLNIAASIIFELGKKGLRDLFTQSPARKAIGATAAEFPNIQNIDDALTKWCQSDNFAEQVEALQADSQHADNRLVNSFIDVGGFYNGINETHASALRVLEAFFKHLETELYKTDFGPIIEARRAKLRDRATQAELQAISQQIQQQSQFIEKLLIKELDNRLPPFNIENSPLVQEKIHFANIDSAVDLL